MPPCCSAGGIFSVALSVTEPHRIGLNPTPHAEACNSALQRSLRGRPLALPGALPLFVTGSCEPTTTVSGLSSRPDCSGPAITRPARQFHYRPKSSLGLWRAQFLLIPRHSRNRQFGPPRKGFNTEGTDVGAQRTQSPHPGAMRMVVKRKGLREKQF